MSSTPLRLPVKVQFCTSASDSQKMVMAPLLAKGFSPEALATRSSPVLERFPTNRQLRMRAELPASRSMAGPVPWARLLRKRQLAMSTGVSRKPCCWTEMPAPQGRVTLSSIVSSTSRGAERPKTFTAPPSE